MIKYLIYSPLLCSSAYFGNFVIISIVVVIRVRVAVVTLSMDRAGSGQPLAGPTQPDPVWEYDKGVKQFLSSIVENQWK